MSGWKDWAVGEVVEESDFQSFVQDQVVQVYDNSGARGSALGTAVAEGMVSYLKDVDSTEVYNGTSWIAVGAGDITAVTAGTALTGGGTSGDVTLNVNQNALFTDGTSGFTMVSGGTAGVTYQPVSPNYIINGAFDIWQRGTSTTTDNTFAADRWRLQLSGATATFSQETFTSGELEAAAFGGANFYGRVVSTAADDFTGLVYRVEDVRTLAGQQVTISLWAKADATRSLRIQTQRAYGSGGSATETVNTSVVTLGTTWQRVSATFTMPSLSGKTVGANSFLALLLINPNSETFTFDYWGLQLEAGSVATPFRRNANSIQGELAACQRYYKRLDSSESAFATFAIGQCGAATYASFAIHHDNMRAKPSVTTLDATKLAASTSTFANVAGTSISVNAARNTKTVTFLALNVASGLVAGNASMLQANNNNDAVIELSAEL